MLEGARSCLTNVHSQATEKPYALSNGISLQNVEHEDKPLKRLQGEYSSDVETFDAAVIKVLMGKLNACRR